MSYEFCPFCLVDIHDKGPIEALLSEANFVQFVVSKHPQWMPQQLACMDCLNFMKKEFTPEASSSGVKREERTIILSTDQLIDKKLEEKGNASLITLHGPDFGKCGFRSLCNALAGLQTHYTSPVDARHCIGNSACLYCVI